MEIKDSILIGAVFLILFFLSTWLQFGLIEDPEAEISEAEKNDPDYYTENFISTGVDKTGKKYQVIADRMVHYPVGDRALLDNPHIIQYDLANNPRHIYAESGWLYDNQSTVLMTGNVRVIQSQSSSSGGAATAQKMVIHLKQKNAS